MSVFVCVQRDGGDVVKTSSTSKDPESDLWCPTSHADGSSVVHHLRPGGVGASWALDIIYWVFSILFGAVPIQFTGFHISQRWAAGHVEPCWHLHVDSQHPGQLGHQPGLQPWQQARKDMLCVTGHSEWCLLCLVVDEHKRLVRILYCSSCKYNIDVYNCTPS